MKQTPLLVGTTLFIAGLIGVVLNAFFVFWMWVLMISGIVVIGWAAMSLTKDKNRK
ncbi:MAG: hypothetical protein Q8P93_00840 [bacterium]|nr:hypothetical protein [bacterium]